MPSLYAPVNGVDTKIKSVYGLMNGVNAKMKSGYALVGGANSKVLNVGINVTITEWSSTLYDGYENTSDVHSDATALRVMARVSSGNAAGGPDGHMQASLDLNVVDDITYSAGTPLIRLAGLVSCSLVTTNGGSVTVKAKLNPDLYAASAAVPFGNDDITFSAYTGYRSQLGIDIDVFSTHVNGTDTTATAELVIPWSNFTWIPAGAEFQYGN